MRKVGIGLLSVGVIAAFVTDAFAGSTVVAPEISPASLSAGLALLAGGVMLARARFRK